MQVATNNGQVREPIGKPGRLAIFSASIFRRAAFAAVMLFLIGTPSFLLFAAFSGGFALRHIIVQVSAFWFPLWAAFAVWVAFEAPALYGLVGPRPAPLAPKALKLSALAVANVAAMFLFLILSRPK